jgi:magnesium chelatase family protein
MNPCSCGWLGDPEKECQCSPGQILKYQKRISGPMLDRIDLHIEVPRQKFEKLTSQESSEEAEKLRQRVESARQIQRQRFLNEKPKIFTNAEMNISQIKKYCQIDAAGLNLLKTAINQFYLSARSYHRLLKVARTIADLNQNEKIETQYVGEALQYRPKINE